jgi:hypothetical protein
VDGWVGGDGFLRRLHLGRHTRHACDNEAAVKVHHTSKYHAELGARRWAAVKYRVTLDRL